eukprot:2051856-Rhodomonas_salina.1
MGTTTRFLPKKATNPMYKLRQGLKGDTTKSKTRNHIPGTNCTETWFLVCDFGLYAGSSMHCTGRVPDIA